jgi:hypothetical protein
VSTAISFAREAKARAARQTKHAAIMLVIGVSVLASCYWYFWSGYRAPLGATSWVKSIECMGNRDRPNWPGTRPRLSVNYKVLFEGGSEPTTQQIEELRPLIISMAAIYCRVHRSEKVFVHTAGISSWKLEGMIFDVRFTDEDPAWGKGTRKPSWVVFQDGSKYP